MKVKYKAHVDTPGIMTPSVRARQKCNGCGKTIKPLQAALAILSRRIAQQYPQQEKDLQLELFAERLARPDPDPNKTILVVGVLFLVLSGLVDRRRERDQHPSGSRDCPAARDGHPCRAGRIAQQTCPAGAQ